MKNRPAERARRHLRAAQWNSAKKLKGPIAVLALTLVAAIVVISLLPTFAIAKGFVIGFVTASLLVAGAWLIFLNSGSYGWSVGKMGEEFTAQVAAGSARRRAGWRLVNGTYFDGHGDIDHILIGPGGVFVIESKFTTSPCRVEAGQVKGITGREPICQARRGAEKLQKMLQYGPGRFDISVRPLVVIWGPGRVRIEQGWQTVENVMLCDGPENERWLPALEGEVLDQANVERIEAYLLGHVEKQVERIAKN